MSEETQNLNEGVENPAGDVQPTAESAMESAPSESVATPEPAPATAPVAVAAAPAVKKVILQERPALATPGDFDWDAFESESTEDARQDRAKLESA